MLCDTLENQEQPSSCSVADPRKPMSAQAVAAQPPPTVAGMAKPATTSEQGEVDNRQAKEAHPQNGVMKFIFRCEIRANRISLR
jgi:hypothetical protein